MKNGELILYQTEDGFSEVSLRASDGKVYSTIHYNLDMILAVGFRVRSPLGVQFRRWANTTLKEYLVKGFAMDDQRLKHGNQWDYFDEWLARIRDIRASEKRFYLHACLISKIPNIGVSCSILNT